jgi:hypothetical protein
MQESRPSNYKLGVLSTAEEYSPSTQLVSWHFCLLFASTFLNSEVEQIRRHVRNTADSVSELVPVVTAMRVPRKTLRLW